jgi:hypothetical protein
VGDPILEANSANSADLGDAPPAPNLCDRRANSLVADPTQRMARAQEKRRLVLRFLRDEIWTSAEIVGLLLGITYPAAHNLLKAMGLDGLTTSSELFVRSKRGAQRAVLHGITAQGLAYAWDMAEVQESRHPWEPSKTNPLFVPHNIETQRARLRATNKGWHTWRPARSLVGLRLPKLPDGEVVDPSGLKVAVEIEREIKTDKRYEAVIGAYVAQMKNDGRWDRVDYLCPDGEFAARLARVFSRLKQLRLEGQTGVPAKVGSLEQSHLDRFRFYANEAWPDGKFVVSTQMVRK